MSKQFKASDRVTIKGGMFNQYGKESGKLVSKTEDLFGRKKWEVQLDDSTTRTFYEADMLPEELTQSQVAGEIKNVEKKLSEVLPNLPQELRTEIPTHLGFCKKAVDSDDKQRAAVEAAYLSGILNIVNESEIASVSLDKIRRWCK